MFSVSIILACLIAIGVCSMLESLLLPYHHNALKQRIGKAWLIHISGLISIFLFFLILTARPINASLLSIAFMLLLILVSNAKYQALKEVLVFSDIAMFSQALRFPRLYFPFLGASALGIILLAPLGLAALLWLEPAIQLSGLAYALLTSLLLLSLTISLYLTKPLPFSYQPNQDQQQFGLLPSLIGYYRQSRTASFRQQLKRTLSRSPFSSSFNSPTQQNTQSLDKTQQVTPSSTIKSRKQTDRYSLSDIIVVQSESFFDPRRLYPQIKPQLLKHFDQLKANAVQSGRLDVPAWGANTLRSEFAFLSGINNNDLGYYRFYPYWFLHRYKLSTLAHRLKAQGYYCVCIHPYHPAFFNRHKIYPAMGFDEFIDISAFSNQDKLGAYTSDQAVTQKILATLKHKPHDQPLFIFAITIENHGPLHLEQVSNEERSAGDNATYYSHNITGSTQELTAYLRHIQQADYMIRDLKDYLSRRKTASTLCFYGDHVPSLPKNYAELDYHDKRTDYIIWHNQTSDQTNPNQTTLSIEHLAKRVLHIAQSVN